MKVRMVMKLRQFSRIWNALAFRHFRLVLHFPHSTHNGTTPTFFLINRRKRAWSWLIASDLPIPLEEPFIQTTMKRGRPSSWVWQRGGGGVEGGGGEWVEGECGLSTHIGAWDGMSTLSEGLVILLPRTRRRYRKRPASLRIPNASNTIHDTLSLAVRLSYQANSSL